MSAALNKKDVYWLSHIKTASSPGSGMYVGLQTDLVPSKVANRMYRLGYVETRSPHNPVHKDRLVITEEGRAALQEADR